MLAAGFNNKLRMFFSEAVSSLNAVRYPAFEQAVEELVAGNGRFQLADKYLAVDQLLYEFLCLRFGDLIIYNALVQGICSGAIGGGMNDLFKIFEQITDVRS